MSFNKNSNKMCIQMVKYKQFLSAGAVVATLSLSLRAIVACNKQATVESDQDKASYAIGKQIGKSLKMQNADIAMSAAMVGVSDGLAGKESQLQPEETQATLQKMQEAATKKAQERSEKNAKDGFDQSGGRVPDRLGALPSTV